MARQEIRQALADAASSVEGITCSPNFVQTTKAGAAMVRFAHMDRASNGFGYMTTWQVAVILPQDFASAEKFSDSNIPALVEALGNEMVVTKVFPAQLAIDTGSSLPVVFVEGSREEE